MKAAIILFSLLQKKSGGSPLKVDRRAPQPLCASLFLEPSQLHTCWCQVSHSFPLESGANPLAAAAPGEAPALRGKRGASGQATTAKQTVQLLMRGCCALLSALHLVRR